MGMFTTIIAPDGARFQIKTGFDDLEEYRVGEVVDWRIFPDYPGQGHLLDGVYDGCRVGPGEDCWVVIKDHRILEIVSFAVAYEDLQAKYDIKPPPRSWWSAKAWERVRKAERRLRLEKRRTARWLHTLPEQDQVPALMACYTRQRLREPGLARRILPPVLVGE